MSEFKKNDKKVIRAWSLFDWANSSYSLVISTAIFPIYYVATTPDKINVLGAEIDNSSLYSFLVSFAFIVVALFSPVLAGIADVGTKRKFFMRIFTTVGGLSCILLFWFQDNSDLIIGSIGFVIATIGHASSLVFYDAYLPEIATEDRMDKVSARGYAYGYFGSVLLLIFIIFMSQSPATFGIAEGTSLPYRIGFALVGLWWIGFAQITFKYLPKEISSTWEKGIIGKGYGEMKEVAKKIASQPNIKKFLISFFFYSAGVQTIIYLATIFAEEELGFETAELIGIVLILQIVALVGAFLFAWYSKKTSNKKALLTMIAIWFVICFVAFFVKAKMPFYLLAAAVGLVLGGIQSISRSTYGKVIDNEKDELTSYFSFYDVLYYLSVVFGTFAFGIVAQLTGSLRYSVLVLSLFFFIAFLVLSKVNFSGLIGEQKMK